MRPRTMWASLSPWKCSEAGAGRRRLSRGAEPDLARAAAHLIGVRSQSFGEGRQLAAELDQIAVAVLPVVEQGKVGADGFDRHGDAGAHGR